MGISTVKDIIQEVEGTLEVPEIRVWCHPHYIGQEGDEYWEIFNTFKEALDFIKAHKEAEVAPVIAFRGEEINIFAEPV